jgi:hypothetical protein
MRTRRRFQPSFDGMPTRIAPSGLAIHSPVVSEGMNPPAPVVMSLIQNSNTTDPTDPVDPPS